VSPAVVGAASAKPELAYGNIERNCGEHVPHLVQKQAKDHQHTFDGAGPQSLHRNARSTHKASKSHPGADIRNGISILSQWHVATPSVRAHDAYSNRCNLLGLHSIELEPSCSTWVRIEKENRLQMRSAYTLRIGQKTWITAEGNRVDRLGETSPLDSSETSRSAKCLCCMERSEPNESLVRAHSGTVLHQIPASSHCSAVRPQVSTGFFRHVLRTGPRASCTCKACTSMVPSCPWLRPHIQRRACRRHLHRHRGSVRAPNVYVVRSRALGSDLQPILRTEYTRTRPLESYRPARQRASGVVQ